MSRRTPFGALLLILLLLPTPALCTICTAASCAMETVAEDCPMVQAPADCCDEMAAMDHRMPMDQDGPADDARPMDHGTPRGHDCPGHSSPDPSSAAADGCCAAADGRLAEAPASAAPAPHGETALAQPGDRSAPDLAADGSGVPRWTPTRAAPRALFTLHRALLI